jgi:hypothetical protein
MHSKKHSRIGAASLLVLAMSTGSVCAQFPDGHYYYGERPLYGDYGFTTSKSCVRTPNQSPPATGFDPITRQLLLDGEAVNGVGSGIMRFARNGTVTMSGVITEVSQSQLSPGKIPIAPRIEFSCDGAYALHPGDKVTGAFSCNIKNRAPGVTVTLAPLSFEGFIGAGRDAINLSFLGDEIQTVTVSVGGNPIQQRHRMCAQSVSLVKL